MNSTILPLCFVVGPIGASGSTIRKHADLLLNSILKPILETAEFGYHVKRADEDADPGMIGDRLIIDILNADIVIADLTYLNPNVFYEMGIRHAAKKPIIHLAAEGTLLPFDNISHRTIFFDLSDWHSTEACRKRLAAAAHAIKSEGYQVSNPVTQANASLQLSESDDPKDRFISELRSRLEKIENTVETTFRKSGSLRAIARDTQESAIVKIFVDDEPMHFRFSNDRIFRDILDLIKLHKSIDIFDDGTRWEIIIDDNLIESDVSHSDVFRNFEQLGISQNSSVTLKSSPRDL